MGKRANKKSKRTTAKKKLIKDENSTYVKVFSSCYRNGILTLFGKSPPNTLIYKRYNPKIPDSEVNYGSLPHHHQAWVIYKWWYYRCGPRIMSIILSTKQKSFYLKSKDKTYKDSQKSYLNQKTEEIVGLKDYLYSCKNEIDYYCISCNKDIIIDLNKREYLCNSCKKVQIEEKFKAIYVENLNNWIKTRLESNTVKLIDFMRRNHKKAMKNRYNIQKARVLHVNDRGRVLASQGKLRKGKKGIMYSFQVMPKFGFSKAQQRVNVRLQKLFNKKI